MRTGSITIKGKGGLVRDVPINLSIEIELKKIFVVTPRGQKLFVEPNVKTHLAMHRLESFIDAYRDDIRDKDSKRPMTFHGLRHTCAAEWYKGYIDAGDSGLEARKKVSKLFEHQKQMKKLCGADYDDNDYVCKWDDGHPLEPNNVTRQFRLFLEKSGLPKIRLDDLRHSAASLLQAMGFSPKEIAEWLGHGD